MEINGFKLKYSTEELLEKINKQTRQIELIDKQHPAYRALSEGDKKALEAAKKNLYKVPMVKGDTFPHYVEGQFGACKVVMKPAPDGTGIVAGGPVRAVLELAGIKNIYSKVYGSRNSINMVRATVNGITNLKTTAKVNALRGK